MKRNPVDSSFLLSVGYENNVLELEFKPEHPYAKNVHQYLGVPMDLYKMLLISPSKGRFYHQFIAGKYTSSKVESSN
jgi:hypothetical protein